MFVNWIPSAWNEYSFAITKHAYSDGQKIDLIYIFSDAWLSVKRVTYFNIHFFLFPEL